MITKSDAEKIVYRCVAKWLEEEVNQGFPLYSIERIEAGLVDREHKPTPTGRKVLAAARALIRELIVRGL